MSDKKISWAKMVPFFIVFNIFPAIWGSLGLKILCNTWKWTPIVFGIAFAFAIAEVAIVKFKKDKLNEENE